jgi:CHAT domain-containing protein
VHAGDEVLGLPRGFLHAGAGGLMTTLWQTDTGFSDRLPGRELAGGASNAVALRLALSEVNALRPEYSHPYYWAPFVLIGDPRQEGLSWQRS